jgi:hypothetical protein
METISLSKEDVSAKLANVHFNKFEEILKGIARKTKEKKLRAGTMSFSEFVAKIAKELKKPSCQEILKMVMELPIVK